MVAQLRLQAQAQREAANVAPEEDEDHGEGAGGDIGSAEPGAALASAEGEVAEEAAEAGAAAGTARAVVAAVTALAGAETVEMAAVGGAGLAEGGKEANEGEELEVEMEGAEVVNSTACLGLTLNVIPPPGAAGAEQGLSLVHLSAQRKRFLLDEG